MLKTSHIQELKRRYLSMYIPTETVDDQFNEHCGVCDEQGIEEAVLADRDYKYDGKVIKISKKNFSKVPNDYKNSTKGKERMITYDDKQGTVSVPVEFTEEVAEGWKKGKYTIKDDKGKILGTYSSGGKAQKAMDDLMQKGDYDKLEVAMVEEVEEDIEEARKSYDDKEMRKKLKTPKYANRKTAGDEKRKREAAQRKKLGLEEVEIDEAFFKVKIPDVAPTFVEASSAGAVKASMRKVLKPDVVADLEIERVTPAAMKKMYRDMAQGKDEVDESVVEMKSSSGYELYHKDFSSAMQHAYAHAKKKGYTVDNDDIDNKVATGPKKPSKGKTNRYILGTDKKKNLHVQVANLDNKRYELNMYFEEVEIEESNELQAIMALDDVGIEATINKKDQVVVKKKDLKKAEVALKKSFKKGGAPELHAEEVEEAKLYAAKGTAYPPTIDNLRMIVKDKQHQTFMFKSGQAKVDLFTASAMVQVYDALKKPEMKKTFEKMIKDKAGFLKTQAFAMKMLSGGK